MFSLRLLVSHFTVRRLALLTLLTVSGLFLGITARGTTPVVKTLYSFVSGSDAPSALIVGSDGNFYGTTAAGGGHGEGTVYSINPAGARIILHSFTGGGEGFTPQAALVQGSDGNFYGTTYGGGTYGGGTVFSITPAGVLTTLYSFTGTGNDGVSPQAALVQGNDGNFYGTTVAGGGSGHGTVFSVTSAGVLTTLYSFTGTGNDGVSPQAALVQGNDGNFYGTTYGGGTNGGGTVFSITPAGMLTTLYSFTSDNGANSNGAKPLGGLVQGQDGIFYGTASRGGQGIGGTVFSITPAGVLTTLHTFTGFDGGEPTAGLVEGNDGSFYGTSSIFGEGSENEGGGTIFSITPTGELTTIYNFIASEGFNPDTALIEGSDGKFYGAAFSGFNYTTNGNCGALFSMTPDGIVAGLYNFTGGDDGQDPSALVQGRDGNLYGTAMEGGNGNGFGTIFSISPGGSLTTLHTFTLADGGEPSELVQGSDGDFYGTTKEGAANNGGTVFSITPSGTFTTLYNFPYVVNGTYPSALVQGSDGNFYGVTDGGGTDSFGTIFSITPAGEFHTLYSFTGGTDGYYPIARLIQGQDGKFYGTTSGGGTNGAGTVFSFTVGGTLTTLYNFPSTNSEYRSHSPLIQGHDGTLYGTDRTGGSTGQGMIYSITPGGIMAILHNFTGNGSDGAVPLAALVQGSDGNIYGTTNNGGTNRAGTVFLLNLAPAVSELPVVTLAATTPSVNVDSGDIGEFTLSLSAAQTNDLIVNYTIKGSAINGSDYILLTGTKKIKAGKTTKPIKVIPQGDLGGANKKVVTLVLAPGTGYMADTTSKVKVKILAGQ